MFNMMSMSNYGSMKQFIQDKSEENIPVILINCRTRNCQKLACKNAKELQRKLLFWHKKFFGFETGPLTHPGKKYFVSENLSKTKSINSKGDNTNVLSLFLLLSS